MNDLENIKRIREREMKEKEWQGIQKNMKEGSTNYGEGSPWMERRSLTQEEVDYFEDKTVRPRLTPDKESFKVDKSEEARKEKREQ